LKRLPREGVLPLAQALEGITDELRGGSGTAILSSETFFHVPPDEMASILEWARSLARLVTVCVYVRPPAAYREGWYRQQIKMSGYDRSFPEHVREAPLMNMRARLDALADIAGRGSLMVRPYLRAAFPKGDVVADFCMAIGVDLGLLAPVDADNLNPSLDAELTEFKLRLNRSGVEQVLPELTVALTSWAADRPPYPRSLYSPPTWDDYVKRTAENHHSVLIKYGLPEELKDIRPEVFTTQDLSQHRFNELMSEFAQRYPELVSRFSSGSDSLLGEMLRRPTVTGCAAKENSHQFDHG
jgi:hypothetical protein